MIQAGRLLIYLRHCKTVILIYLFSVAMEEVQQGSNGTELQTTTITASQFSQLAQQVTNTSAYNNITNRIILLVCVATVALGMPITLLCL